MESISQQTFLNVVLSLGAGVIWAMIGNWSLALPTNALIEFLAQVSNKIFIFWSSNSSSLCH